LGEDVKKKKSANGGILDLGLREVLEAWGGDFRLGRRAGTGACPYGGSGGSGLAAAPGVSRIRDVLDSCPRSGRGQALRRNDRVESA